ncbi:hypothetical protein PTD2_14557 [Pseudoalteromonas tunicata D2]|uniref:Uncharacterized protein n=1 Tax=Pseudoalteromonas tunicata D2 TaxID=87626 RepID=A4CCH6_9GAMM|nr:hypothetical protein PTD2_14557 [Pseudoalteromonas tunicata D2]
MKFLVYKSTVLLIDTRLALALWLVGSTVDFVVSLLLHPLSAVMIAQLTRLYFIFVVNWVKRIIVPVGQT